MGKWKKPTTGWTLSAVRLVDCRHERSELPHQRMGHRLATLEVLLAACHGMSCAAKKTAKAAESLAVLKVAGFFGGKSIEPRHPDLIFRLFENGAQFHPHLATVAHGDCVRSSTQAGLVFCSRRASKGAGPRGATGGVLCGPP